MSVLKSNRNKSDIQFLETAREIELFIYRITKHFPKRYSYTLSAELIKLSQSLLNNLKAANSIYPTNAHELQIRRDYWIYANNSLQCLISQCGVAKELATDVKSSSWEQLGLMLQDEAKLISAVKASDMKRFSTLT